MATDGPTPPPCDQEIYSSGEVMCVIRDVTSNKMEQWVKRIAAESGQRVDWHYVAGAAVMKALGDTKAVCAAMEKVGAP